MILKKPKFRVWDKGEKCFWYWGITDSYPRYMEIIGNMYENSELLREAK